MVLNITQAKHELTTKVIVILVDMCNTNPHTYTDSDTKTKSK